MHRRPKMIAEAILFSLLACSPAGAQQAGDRFARWDADKDGKVTREELPQWFKGSFDRIDTNKDGSISPEEEKKFAASRPNPQGQGPGPRARLPDSVRVERDLAYAGTDNPKQRLDLYLPKSPKSDKPLPVVAFVHGGAWQVGDKSTGYFMIAPLVESGDYAGVCIGYRLSGEATWPAQIHDCKAAIRWLRANAKKYNLDPDKIGVMGSSAGGHLVAMLGTTGSVSSLEGTLGDFTSVSSRVTCVVDQFGTTDFSVIRSAPDGPVSRLLGVDITKDKETARSASPMPYVSKDSAPFLIIHGTQDPVVEFSQSEMLNEALKKVGVDSWLVPVTGAGHGNFGTQEVPARVRQFFDKYLRGQDVSISDKPIVAMGDPAKRN